MDFPARWSVITGGYVADNLHIGNQCIYIIIITKKIVIIICVYKIIIIILSHLLGGAVPYISGYMWVYIYITFKEP